LGAGDAVLDMSIFNYGPSSRDYDAWNEQLWHVYSCMRSDEFIAPCHMCDAMKLKHGLPTAMRLAATRACQAGMAPPWASPSRISPHPPLIWHRRIAACI
jgi:hypothetical protein